MADSTSTARTEPLMPHARRPGFDAIRGNPLDEPRFVPAGEYGYIERED